MPIMFARLIISVSLDGSRLGLHVSNGCVRLNINNAKWIYGNIPRGTTVRVYRP